MGATSQSNGPARLSSRRSARSTRRHQLPAFRAIADIRVVLPGRPAVVPVGTWRRHVHRLRRCHIDRTRGIVARCGHSGGDAGNRQHGSRRHPSIAPRRSAMVIVILRTRSVAAVITAVITAMIATIGQRGSRSKQRQGECDAEGARGRFHKPSNARARQRMTHRGRGYVSDCDRQAADRRQAIVSRLHQALAKSCARAGLFWHTRSRCACRTTAGAGSGRSDEQDTHALLRGLRCRFADANVDRRQVLIAGQRFR